MSALLLFQLHQHSIAVLGMQKHDRFAVSSDPRLRTQTADILALDVGHSGVDVVDLDADVVDATSLVLLQESGYGRLCTQRV